MTDMALSKAEFGRRMRAARERASLSQQEVADAMGVDWRQTQRWDSGSALPRANRIPQLAKILGVEPTYLQEPVDEHAVDRTARIVEESAVTLRTALGLLDELTREVRGLRTQVDRLTPPAAQAEEPEIPRYPRRPDEGRRQAG